MPLLRYPIPNSIDYPNDFLFWYGIAPRRYFGKNKVPMTAQLYTDYYGNLVHIGYGIGYMQELRKKKQNYFNIYYNLHLYIPLLRLHRIPPTDLYTQFLNVSLDPYYIYISPTINHNDTAPGTIAVQVQKTGQLQKKLP